MTRRASIVTIAVSCLLGALLQAAEPDAAGSGSSLPAAGLPAPETFVTRHSGVFNGQKIEYLATAGYTLLTGSNDVPNARLFSIAYTRDGVKDPARRPVIFMFNGGPGSPSFWLHMGAFGPRRVVLSEDLSAGVAPPYEVVDNDATVLDVADLVFIDPVETGFSRVLPGVRPEQFFSVPGDASSVAQFIQTWVRANARRQSPKYVLGESYGTIRAAAVADTLIGLNEPIALNGVALLGQALNIIETSQRSGNIMGYVVALPTLSAIAWYHHRVERNGRTFESFLDAARLFARTEYLTALAQGRDIPPVERDRTAARLSEFTGIAPSYYLQNDLAITKERFRTELLRDQGKLIGRYDARYDAAAPANLMGDDPVDPSMNMRPAYVAAMLEHLRTSLKVSIDTEYRSSYRVPSWDYGSPPSPFSDWKFVGQLSQVMKANPQMRLFIGSGYYDTTTTFGAAEYAIARSDIPRERVRLEHYPAGHMLYTDQATFVRLTADIRGFIRAGEH
jgi:carboxypeptidase C (cathepsin A)